MDSFQTNGKKILSLIVMAFLLALAFFFRPASAISCSSCSCIEEPVSEHAPEILSVALSPQPATAYDDLMCTVSAKDIDSDLEYARFKWYVNGHIVKTQEINLQGSNANIQATLYSENIHQGDVVKCLATVYDSSGLSDSKALTASIEYDQPCSVDVHGLDYKDNTVSANIKNTGIYTEEITYTITIDSTTRMTGHVTLDSGEEQQISYEYHFADGNHDISFTAVTDCGYVDRENIWYQVLEESYNHYPHINSIHITPQNPNENEDIICNVDVSDIDGDLDYVKFLWYVNSNLERVWETNIRGNRDMSYDILNKRHIHYGDIVKCRAIAYDTRGNDDSMNVVTIVTEAGGQGTATGTPETSGCGISITGIDYNDWIISGNTEYIKVNAKNTGSSDQFVNAKVYVDGYMKASSSHFIPSGEDYVYVFGLPLETEGKHEIYIFLYSGCGSYDSKKFEVNVKRGQQFTGQCNHNGICEYGESSVSCPGDCEAETSSQEETKETSVKITPLSFDIIQHRSKTIIIDVFSVQKQKFSIDISGIPSEWLSYNRIEEVEGSKRIYVYVTPKITGSYAINLTVKALSENREFNSNINLFVTLPDIKPIGNQNEEDKHSFLASLSSWVFGGEVLAYIIVTLLIVVLAILLYFGFALFSKGNSNNGSSHERKPMPVIHQHRSYTQGIKDRVVSGNQNTTLSNIPRAGGTGQQSANRPYTNTHTY